MDALNNALATFSNFLWNDIALYVVLGTGVLFTIWSGFSQYRALTEGTGIVRGKYDDPNDPGAINHFQALSAALSATVGLGNIGGVALAISLGGPGAVFWMWVVGLFGMAIKLTEVTMSMLYRNTDDPDNPHGGPMWVISKGLARMNPRWATIGKWIGILFCITLLVSTITGGNMFQAWNVAELTEENFHVPGWITGVVLAVLVGAVIIGGIKRIGRVAGTLVPFMVTMYLIGGTYVLIKNWGAVPEMFSLIFKSAFSPQEAVGAFIGGSAFYAFFFGMKRALFSNEAGQGSSPIAHSAAKTDEPAREGLVAGLEPFIDTLVVCTFTSLVILSSGVWSRAPEVVYPTSPAIVPVELNVWSIEQTSLPDREGEGWREGDNVFTIVFAHANRQAGNNRHRLTGVVRYDDIQGFHVDWDDFASVERPSLREAAVYIEYPGATLTSKAFDSALDGLGKYLVTLAAWLFAVSTMISWSYYGEQGVVFIWGDRAVLGYKYVFCILIVVATLGFVETDTELDNLTGIGTGVMLWVNIPIMLMLGYQAMRAYKSYIARLKSGALAEEGHKPPPLEDLISGRDVR